MKQQARIYEALVLNSEQRRQNRERYQLKESKLVAQREVLLRKLPQQALKLRPLVDEVISPVRITSSSNYFAEYLRWLDQLFPRDRYASCSPQTVYVDLWATILKRKA